MCSTCQRSDAAAEHAAPPGLFLPVRTTFSRLYIEVVETIERLLYTARRVDNRSSQQMDDKAIIEARRRAEKAVEGMTDATLKLKAFEQVFAKLLGESEEPAGSPGRPSVHRKRVRTQTSSPRPPTLTGRVLGLRDDGFFSSQRSLSDVREELRSLGFSYPLTTLSGVMQSLVRNRELRRERVSTGGKKTFKYGNA